MTGRLPDARRISHPAFGVSLVVYRLFKRRSSPRSLAVMGALILAFLVVLPGCCAASSRLGLVYVPTSSASFSGRFRDLYAWIARSFDTISKRRDGAAIGSGF
jgi:hypothetical protein